MKSKKFLRKLKFGAIALMLASLSLGVVTGCRDKGGNDSSTSEGGGGNSSTTETPEVEKGLGMYYFEAGSDRYQLALEDGNKAIFVTKEAIKTGTYTVNDKTIVFTFDGVTTTATMDETTLVWAYEENAQMRFFKQVNYIVSYEEFGGSEVADSQVVNGQTVEKPADPVRAGYEFLGWYADSEYQTPFMFGTQIVTSNVTLYARWAVVTPGSTVYTVDFDLGYDGATAPAPVDTKSGKIYDAPTVTREGYKFCGWWMSDYEDGSKLTKKWTEDTVFTANTTLFAVWEAEDLGTKLSAPMVEVTSTGIQWTAVDGARNYKISITSSDENFVKIMDETTSATTYPMDFATMGAGDYYVEVTTMGYSEEEHSDVTKRTYINKALGRVSQFTVLEGKTLLFNRVENAEYYVITVDCGDPNHNHTEYYNGDSTFFNFANCQMQDGGITFKVTAVAEGYASVTSETFTYKPTLEKVEGLAIDEETEMLTWYAVKDATNYIVSISCGNPSHDHDFVNVGSKTSFSLKECVAVDGKITINVTAQTKGYVSAGASTIEYAKTKLPTPSNITVVAVDSNTYTLSWSAVEGATKYQIMIDNQVFETTETSYNIKDVIAWIPEAKYDITVKAVSDTNASVWSDPVSAYNLVMPSKATYKNGVVSWDSVLGATCYEVKVGENGSPITTTEPYAEVTLTQEGENVIYVRFANANGGWSKFTDCVCVVNNVLPIIFDSRGGSTVETQYKVTGDPIELPTPTRAGYTFAGWYNTPKGPESNGSKYEATVFEENTEMVLYAYWTSAQYTLNYSISATEGTIESGATSGTATYLDDYKLEVPKAVDSTKVFLGWFAGTTEGTEQLTDDRGYSIKPWSLKEDATVYAVFVNNALAFYPVDNGESYSVVAGSNAAKLTSITIPTEYNGKPVTIIEGNAFKDKSKLVVVNIPNSIKLVEDTAFMGCKRLEQVNVFDVGEKIPTYWSSDGALIKKDDATGSTILAFYPWAKTGSYVIPEGVTEIPMHAFKGRLVTSVEIGKDVSIVRGDAFLSCSLLEKVTFAEGGTADLTFESNSFKDCKALKNITLPARLKTLEVDEETHTMSVFAGCGSLTHINVERNNQYFASRDGVITNKLGTEIVFCPTARRGSYEIPSGISSVADYAFANCTALTEIVVPGYVESIGNYAFAGCSNVVRVVFSGKGAVAGMETTIGDYAFANIPALRVVDFQDGSVVTTIGAYAFTNATALGSITIPATLTYVGDYAFENARALNEVSFAPNGSELGFGEYVFSNCLGLKTITLPATVTEIKLGIFDGCVNIEAVKIDEANEYYKSIDGVVYTEDETVLMFFPKGKEGTDGVYTVPSTVTTIEEGAFRGVSGIHTINIGNSVTYIGKYAFEESASLTTVNFDTTAGDPLVIEEYAFAGSAHISSISLPDRTQKIGAYAFYRVAMTSVAFPANLEEIGDYAFAGTAITSVEIPKNVTVFGEHVFDGCTKLATVSFADGYVGTAIPVGTFMNTAITAITIPESVTTIGYLAFNNCKNLKSVDFGTGSTPLQIGYTAKENPTSDDKMGVFLNCTGLTSITIPDRVSYIGYYAFSGCTGLTAVDIKETSNLQRIGNYAFANCKGLTSFYVPKTVKNSEFVNESISQEYAIGDCAFRGATKLATLTIAEGGEGDFSIGLEALTETAITRLDLPARLAPIWYIWNNAGTLAYEKRDGLYSDSITSMSKLAEINVAKNADGSYGQYYGSKDGVLYRTTERDGKMVLDELMIVPYKYAKTTLEIPYTVSMVGEKMVSGRTIIQNPSTCAITTLTFEATPQGEEVVALRIANNAFNYYAKLTSVEFPKEAGRLVEIGNNAFASTQITSINLPASLQVLGANAFQNCTAATSINFADGIQITEIQSDTFNGCSNKSLTTVTIPANVVTIGTRAFQNCSNIATLDFEDNSECTTIKFNAFSGTKISTLTLPEKFTTVEKTIFGTSNSTIKTLNLSKAFAKFEMNSESFLIGLTGLTTINVHADNPNYKSDNGVLYSKDGKELVFYPRAKTMSNTSFETPAGLKTIGAYAFYYNSKITSLTISADLIGIGDWAFYRCTKLTTINFKDRTSTLSIGEDAFYYCTALKENKTETLDNGSTRKVFSIPSTVVLGKEAFRYTFRTTGLALYVVFEGKNESTSLNATFYSCTKIYGVENVPSRLDSMTETFYGCTSMASVTFYEDKNNAKITTMAGTFYNCSALTSIVLPNVEGMTIGSTTTTKTGVFQGCTNLTSVTIADCATIGEKAFYNCSKLTSIDLPDSVAKIGKSAFYGTGLTSIKLPMNLSEIGDEAFYGCSGLTSLSIPNYVSFIGANAFQGCGNVATVEIGDSVTSIGAYAFAGMSKVKTLVLPDMLETIGERAFGGWTSLTALDLPESLMEIGAYAFYNCTSLKTLTGGENVVSFGDYSFANCSSLETFTIPQTMNYFGLGVLSGCASLKTIDAGVEFVFSNGILYNASYTKMIFVTDAVSGDLVIPDTIAELGASLFKGAKITSVVIPDTITEIPESLFENCTSLVSVKMPANLETIGARAFYNCRSLTTIDIPNTVSASYATTFYPGDGKETGWFLDEAKEAIGDYAFYGCSSLESVNFEEGGIERLSIGKYAFANCTSLKTTGTSKDTFTIPSRVRSTYLPNDVWFEYTPANPNPTKVGYGMDVRMVQGIGVYAFANTGIVNLVFEDDKDNMSEKLFLDIGAFYGCEKLETVVFGDTLGNVSVVLEGRESTVYIRAAIAEKAFEGCGSLNKVTFKNTEGVSVASGAMDASHLGGVTVTSGGFGMSRNGEKEDWQDSGTYYWTIDGYNGK